VLKDQPHTIDGKQVECKVAIPKDFMNTSSESVTNEDQSHYNSKKIFVGGLHPSLRETEMQQYFEQFGKIEQCVIMYDKPTGNSRGFGFILYHDEESADRVMAFKIKHNILGKWVDCRRAMPKEFINSTKNQNFKNTV
jgi:RNA-binding protein Musashi